MLLAQKKVPGRNGANEGAEEATPLAYVFTCIRQRRDFCCSRLVVLDQGSTNDCPASPHHHLEA